MEQTEMELEMPGTIRKLAGLSLIIALSSCIAAPISTPTSRLEPTFLTSPIVDQPGELPRGAVIVFRRSGGIAGLDEEWTLYADGRVVSKDGRQWQTSAEQVSGLLERLDALGFFDLEATTAPVVPCCDRFYYELAVIGNEQTNTVATYDGAPDTPPGVWQAIEAVTNFLDKVRGYIESATARRTGGVMRSFNDRKTPPISFPSTHHRSGRHVPAPARGGCLV
jgi:hypothetical protein